MKLASIEKIGSVYPHPNADSLEFVTVLGYQSIVPKGKWEVGQYCVFIQPDTVLPDSEWAKFYKEKHNRVKAIKLRGEWSFGIVERLDILTESLYSFEKWHNFTPQEEGEDVTEVLGVTKYEAPQPQDLDAKGGLPHGIPKTDEERYQNLRLDKFLGCEVDVTVKIDGQSFTAYCKDGEVGVCGRTMQYGLDRDNNFTRTFKNFDLADKLRTYCKRWGVNIALRGEQYGGGIQNSTNNPHAKRPLGVMFFNCWDIDNRRYFKPGEQHYYVNVCENLGLPMVPMLYENTILTEGLIKKLQNNTELNFEGVVIKGQFGSFKVINLHYDSKK